MPELPEVEVTRRGLLPVLAGRRLTEVVVREPRLRYPVPEYLGARLTGRRLVDIARRGKYLLLRFERGTDEDALFDLATGQGRIRGPRRR